MGRGVRLTNRGGDVNFRVDRLVHTSPGRIIDLCENGSQSGRYVAFQGLRLAADLVRSEGGELKYTGIHDLVRHEFPKRDAIGTAGKFTYTRIADARRESQPRENRHVFNRTDLAALERDLGGRQQFAAELCSVGLVADLRPEWRCQPDESGRSCTEPLRLPEALTDYSYQRLRGLVDLVLVNQ